MMGLVAFTGRKPKIMENWTEGIELTSKIAIVSISCGICTLCLHMIKDRTNADGEGPHKERHFYDVPNAMRRC